jgi:hypothetical protein
LEDFAGIPGTTRTMLEQPSLLLRPWNAAPFGTPVGTDVSNVPQAAGLVRAVLDGTGATVGLARQPLTQTPNWLRWLSRRTLEVYEAPDNSLVFAMRRGWGWRSGWHLIDADERLVGTLRGRMLVDGFGQFLATVESVNAAGRGRFLAADGRVLGEYAMLRDGTRIAFGPDLEGNPFAKMLLLGAVLVHDG